LIEWCGIAAVNYKTIFFAKPAICLLFAMV